MANKRDLPVFGGVLGSLGAGPPSLDDARAKLGGPWIGGPDIGRVVRIPASIGHRVGVVIHATETHRDVWIGAGRVQHVSGASVEEAEEAEGDETFDAVVADARMHAELTVEQPVVFQHRDGRTEEGVLVEKLRFGSLVGTEDGRVLAVSFRRLGPRGTEPPS